VRSIDLVDAVLPVPGLNGRRRVAFASDLHLNSREQLEEFLEACRRLSADTLLLGGDYLERRRLVQAFAAGLGMLGKTIYGIFGNNDWRYRDELLAASAGGRIRWLFNECVSIDGLTLYGACECDDCRALSLRLPSAPLLVLAHSPDTLYRIAPDVPLAYLAGHVHGGQVRFGFLKRWWTHTRIGRAHAEGRSRRGSNEIFIGRGTGCSLLPIRNVPREIYDLLLEREDHD